MFRSFKSDVIAINFGFPKVRFWDQFYVYVISMTLLCLADFFIVLYIRQFSILEKLLSGVCPVGLY